ncbi:MAG: hypothetical protein ACJ78Q_08590 [Chloroflexia bacterium]
MTTLTPWSPTNPSGWTPSPEQQAYIAWLALPKRDRMPKTETALASQFGVNRGTLRNWRNLPALRAEVNKLCRSLIGSRLSEVLESIENSALSGSTPHQRLYFELLGMIGSHKDKTLDPTNPSIPPGVPTKLYIGVDLDSVGRAEPNPNPNAKPSTPQLLLPEHHITQPTDY